MIWEHINTHRKRVRRNSVHPIAITNCRVNIYKKVYYKQLIINSKLYSIRYICSKQEEWGKYSNLKLHIQNDLLLYMSVIFNVIANSLYINVARFQEWLSNLRVSTTITNCYASLCNYNSNSQFDTNAASQIIKIIFG